MRSRIQKNRTTRLVVIALLAALIAVMTQIILPIGPVPFSMAVFAIMFAGAVLPPVSSLACIGVFVLMGCVGIPVFTNFQAGPQVLFGPTGGYIFGYFLLVLSVSMGVKYTKRLWLQVVCAMLGLAGCYLLGTLWYVVLTGASFWSGFVMCVLPFILPDIVKAVLALGLAKALEKRTGGKLAT